jgi:hypothetical protein
LCGGLIRRLLFFRFVAFHHEPSHPRQN